MLRESVRIVRMDRGIIITQTRHGFVCANAGVDASNVAGRGDRLSAAAATPTPRRRAARGDSARSTGAHVAVIITDSFGRPWRNGIVNVAIGVAGIAPLVDYRGQPDDFGRAMHVSVLAVADELASAAELVMGKVSRCPMALVRGYISRAARGQLTNWSWIPATDMFR